jgi:CRISP-associated protein Cas1
MKTLYLSGHGISIRVDHSHLMIRDGCEFERPEPMTYELKPKHDEFDNIVIYGHSGNITLEAIKWLSRQNIQLTILNWDGCLVASVTIPEPKQGANRFAQYRAFDSKNRVEAGKKYIDAMIRTSVAVLDWVAQRHPDVRETKKGCFRELDEYKDRLPAADTIAKVRGIEGMVACNYWLILKGFLIC